MHQYQYFSSHPVQPDEDRARLDLLKCSENLEEYRNWDNYHPSGSSLKIKTKKYYTQFIKNKQMTLGSKRLMTLQSIKSSRRVLQPLPIRQEKIRKAQRRYTTEYDGQGDGLEICKRTLSNCDPLTSLRTELKSPAVSNLISRTRSKTVFIHMLKNKSASLNFQQGKQYKILHNLSGLKVRIMAKKMGESRSLNFSYSELKQQIEQVKERDKLRERMKTVVNKGIGGLMTKRLKRVKGTASKENLRIHE